MLISGRRAAHRLEIADLTPRQARRVLASGLAGEPVKVGHTLGYDQDRVRAVAERGVMSERELDVACPHGLFVLRCDLDLTAPREERLAAIRGPWAFSRWTSVWLRHRIGLYGAFPLVATVAGFVQIGADIIDVLPEGDGRVLRLRDPGPWFDQVGDRRVQTGPGRPWAIRGWDPSASPGEVRRVG